MKGLLISLILLVFFFASACANNRAEYEKLRSVRDDYLAQLIELRQANDTISNNIVVAYQEIENIKKILEEKKAQERRLNM
jgi:thioredoxin-related protein